MKPATIVALAVLVVAQAPASMSQTPNETRAIAEEAYIFAYPMLENYQRFFRGADPAAAMNRLVHARQLAGPKSRSVIRPNNDTLYSTTWLDLRATPVVIAIPPVENGRYWSIQVIDIYTHNAAIISPRNAPSTGAQFLIAGPSWKGAPPAGVEKVVRTESQFAFALLRLEVQGADDVSNVTRLQDQIRLTALDAGAAAPKLVFPPFNRERADSDGFIEYLNFLLAHVEFHESEKAAMARFSRVGIGAGRPYDAASIDSDTLGAIRLGVRDARDRINAGRDGFARPRGRWTTADDAFGDRARMQGRYLARSQAARLGLWGLDREEAVYMGTAVDADGAALNGSASYVLRFGPGELPPATAFWSVTMYGDDGFLVANEKQRYSIGDRTAGLVKDADGGLTLRVSSQPPGAAGESNWLPAPPGPFSLSLRIYLPEARVSTYTPPPVRRVN